MFWPKDKLIGAMMDIYARVGRTVNVENLFQRIRPNRVTYNILMRSLRGDINKATALFYQMLNDPSIPPDIASFSTIINEWAESYRPDAYEKVTELRELLQRHPKCVELNLRPDTRMYNAVLKCMIKSNVANAGQLAMDILDEMEEHCTEDGRDSRPDEFTFCLVIKAFLNDGDVDGAESILERMSQSSHCNVTLQAYTEFLSYYGHQNNPASAERAEQILHYMKFLAKNGKPELQPTITEYHAVLMAWARAGVPQSYDKLWNVYQLVKADNVVLNFATYTSLLMSFAKFKRPDSIEKAENILSCLEHSKKFQPNSRHYTAVIKGWLDEGDPEKAMRVLIRCAKVSAKNQDKSQEPDTIIIDMVRKTHEHAH
jgi:pentatricopeptide repeat protein